MNPHIPTHPPWTSALVPELSPHADRRGSAYSEGEGKSDDVEMEPRPRPRPRVPPGARKGLGTHYDLRPLLVRRHILMISLSGTIGMGILIGSGQILRLCGSAGALLSYLFTGFILHCVVSSLGEMVSLIPESGALMNFPTRFVDGALGWTVGIAYWFCYSMGVTTLVTSTAILATGFNPDVSQGWIITGVLAVVIIINVFGIRVFGEVEYVIGFLKVVLLVGLIILMLFINRGAGPKGKVHGVDYWKAKYRFSPNFGGKENLDGDLGRFLSIWKGMTLAAFGYIGIEIVAVTASEAKYPRDDLPRATKRIFWLTFSLYLAAIFSVSLAVPYTDGGLSNLFDPRNATGDLSPFVIAIKNAGITFLPGFVSAALIFANMSTANTSLFVASRTLYGMAVKLDHDTHPVLSVFRHTTKNGVPLAAIFASCIFAPLAYLQCGGGNAQELLGVFSQIETVACLIVWLCQCLAFIRFYHGLQTGTAPYDRASGDYPYASPGQPAAAYIGAVGCALLILFNGFDVFIFRPFKQADFLAAYLAVFVFVLIYAVTKLLVVRTPMVGAAEMSYSIHREAFDRTRVRRRRGWAWEFASWVFG
ncbi:amino acid permease/ SLC12A domain-containing protein [Tricharina praecox]|uniref:amino acid permease/ SLC12A domain-containing protein n=1 Tax=Tricharina praecox TaxID=43433 RepID=UPI0022205E91|nr:amino acid permease/ SLC12A domain-containing protein [Tricharina praecox]XP_051335135.1 amino acid permease/ SLC12A domain-containing protein [Tricharina praecox]KAI5840897.1 amino acid permease/ SLC12A domain-containing protein [Tricharina praecox]KAI5842363.1 amino acid permease/ SLC12A domain-containing protein [Tricharina praecox]